jgi:hypothetical protein
MNLQEQINRMKSMMGVINEDKQHIDKILDKIIKYGMDSLSDMDREYLGNPSSQELNQLVKKRKDRIESLWSYDPREDTEFFDELSSEINYDFDFSKYSDEDIEEGRYSIIYDEVDEKELLQFMKIFEISDEDMRNENGTFKGWPHLDSNIQDKFKEYIDDIY